MTRTGKPQDRWWESSKAYIKANEDIDFLNQDELRPVRLQLELLKPELSLQKHRIRSTVVVFGGTRIVHPDGGLPTLGSARLAPPSTRTT